MHAYAYMYQMTGLNVTLTGDRLTMMRSLAVARARRLRVDRATLVVETATVAAAAAFCTLTGATAAGAAATAAVTLVACGAPWL